MKHIAVLKTESKQETRVTLLPSDAAKLVKTGVSLSVEAGLGNLISVEDTAYIFFGMKSALLCDMYRNKRMPKIPQIKETPRSDFYVMTTEHQI